MTEFTLMLLSSFLIFFTMTFLMESFLVIFRITNPRIRALCRILPVLKLPFDLVFNGLFHQSLFNRISPLSCDSYLQQWILNLLSVKMTLAQFISSQIPCIWLRGILIGICVVSFALGGRKLIQLLYSFTYLRYIRKSAKPCLRPIVNKRLQQQLQECKAILLTSDKLNIPFSAYSRYILMPTNLVNEFSQKEFEAVVAHELEHLRWRDPMMKFVCTAICALFWWIPTKWWLNRLDDEQERASDSCVMNYGLDRKALATAIVKVVSQAKSCDEKLAICCLATHKSAPLQRLQMLLEQKTVPVQGKIQPFCAMAAAIGSFMLISFWIC